MISYSTLVCTEPECNMVQNGDLPDAGPPDPRHIVALRLSCRGVHACGGTHAPCTQAL